MERHNLYLFRCDKRLTQAEMAEKIGVSRITYANVEKGKRDGTIEFWNKFQKAFDVPDTDMWKYQKKEKANEREQKKNGS